MINPFNYLKSCKKQQKGQAAVEYILLIAALVAIMLPVMKIVANQLTANCPSESFVCRLQTIYTGEGSFGGSFRRFTLRR